MFQYVSACFSMFQYVMMGGHESQKIDDITGSNHFRWRLNDRHHNNQPVFLMLYVPSCKRLHRCGKTGKKQ